MYILNFKKEKNFLLQFSEILCFQSVFKKKNLCFLVIRFFMRLIDNIDLSFFFSFDLADI